MLFFCLSFITAHADKAGSHIQNWSDSKPPTGWNKDAYSPSKSSPDYGADFNADGSQKAVENGNPVNDPSVYYDPHADPYHPLKNPNGPPPREWLFEQEPVLNDDGKPVLDKDGNPVTRDKEVTVDKDNNGKPDKDEDGNLVKQKVPVSPADGSVIQRESADIDWGERFFDQQLIQPVIITNLCQTPQPVFLTVNDLPYLTLPQTLTIPAGATVTVNGDVKLPPEPPPPLRLGLPGEPGWGHVDFGNIIVPPGQKPPKLHQPNFVPIKGSIEAWHPWAPAGDSNCNAKLTVYTVTGHIHFRPPSPPKGPEKIAEADVCELYWKLGVPPDQLKDEDCTDKIRQLATTFKDAYLAPYIQMAPEEWGWLPTTQEIQQMSIDELLAMKKRAEIIMGHRESADISAASHQGYANLHRREFYLIKGLLPGLESEHAYRFQTHVALSLLIVGLS